jgi:hypothetical protein
VSRILFVMVEPGYLRMYSTTVQALAERGHEVLLAYDKPAKGERDTDVLASAPPNLRAVGRVPPHGGTWRQALIDLGCAIDYVRFLSRREGTAYLRGRMDRYLPERFRVLRQVKAWPDWFVRALFKLSRLVEQAVPVDSALVGYLEAIAPRALVISPLVLRGPGGAQQTQLVKAARTLGIPVALAVGSWDHLSSKGFIRVAPDLVLVWNEIQRREAAEMHDVPPDSVVVTGSQAFDLWFGRQPVLDRQSFLSRVGLPSDRPVILYAGSSRGITPAGQEAAFVREWLAALRACGDPAVRSAAVLIRPHLGNVDAWAEVDLSDLGPVSIFPRQRPRLPMSELETADYFHSMFFSDAVVGINTSAMIEATILDRPVLTVQVEAFRDSQAGTKHFHYLLPTAGGCVLSSHTFAEHVRQLSDSLANPEGNRAARQRFVEAFVRPRGRERPALDAVVEAIERVPGLPVPAQPAAPLWLAPVRWAFRQAMGRVPSAS